MMYCMTCNFYVNLGILMAKHKSTKAYFVVLKTEKQAPFVHRHILSINYARTLGNYAIVQCVDKVACFHVFM